MPRTLRTAGALTAILVLFATPAVGHADEPKDAPSDAPGEVSVAVAPYLGFATGEHTYATAGVDAILSVHVLRVGVLTEAGSEIFGRSVATLGGFVGVGLRSEDRRLDAMLGLEAGYHGYSGLGDGLFEGTVRGGNADLGFGGVRGSAVYRFGQSRRVGLGLLAYARSDFGHRDVTVTTTGGLFSSGPTTRTVRAGDQSVGAAVRLSVAF